MKFLRNRRINMNKFIGCLVLSVLTTMPAFAQSGTNSPYSQYGLGDMADEGVGFNKGMGGVGLGFRKGFLFVYRLGHDDLRWRPLRTDYEL